MLYFVFVKQVVLTLRLSVEQKQKVIINVRKLKNGLKDGYDRLEQCFSTFLSLRNPK
jgi:hypothetical protein